MLEQIFHRWEHRLASSTTDRIVRPFDWGVEWLPDDPATAGLPASERVEGWVDEGMRDSQAFFTPPPTRDYVFEEATADRRRRGEAGTLTFPSAYVTPHPVNNTVVGRWFPSAKDTGIGPARGRGSVRPSARVRVRVRVPVPVLVLVLVLVLMRSSREPTPCR